MRLRTLVNMKLKCIVIDDEQYAVDALVGYIEQLENLVVFATYTDPIAALNGINVADEIDLVFLDVEMPGLGGLELAKIIRAKTRYLIFTTSHTQHAITAFDLNASHYLLKPISFAKFALAVTSLLFNEKNRLIEPAARKKLQFLKGDSKGAYHYIDHEAITHIEAARNYVVIYTDKDEEKFVVYMGLNHVTMALDQADFIRVNKSNVIAKAAIKKVEGNVILLKNGKSIQLGETYRTAFIAFLNDNLLK